MRKRIPRGMSSSIRSVLTAMTTRRLGRPYRAPLALWALSLWPMLSVLGAAPARADEPPPQASVGASGAAPSSTQAPNGGAASLSMPVDELEGLLAKVLSGPDASRKAAAKEVSDLGSTALSAIHVKLGEARRTGGVSNVMRELKDQNEGEGSGGDALIDGLLKLRSQNSAAYKATLTTAVLIRALAHIANTASTRELVTILNDHGGVFRPEITRQVAKVGEAFVPALIEARRSSPETRRWAHLQLEALGKKTAGDAAQVKSSTVLCDVLRAYGTIHDIEALAVILSFVNTDRAQVRAAAREALSMYGGDGLWKLRESYTNLTGKPTPEGWSADQVAKELFLAFDKVRLQEVYELLDEGLKLEKEHKLLEATQAFDKALARQPLLDRRAEMIPAYVAYADSLEEKDLPQALAFYRKAARLDPKDARKAQIESGIAYLEGKELLQRGVTDEEAFRRALTLDPTNAKARAELSKLDTATETKAEKSRRYLSGLAVILAAAIGIFFFGARSRKRADA